ncbi:MFS general substrate transporter [Teratosphaeria destructans]|uniref:MFS general substrate transporter n=1 Tax=Teratosphaeria destructans TaxID=418781 RepID=A0A9W7SH65_9PEZI|nr:MFS general substrate transporter [Teratosphaeria destructans]
MAHVPIEIKNIFAHAKSLDDSPGTPSSSRLTEPDSHTPTIDPAIERHVVRRCDLRVIPPVFMMFMMTFWDRVNIGNAKIQGMTTELGLVGNEFNIATMILFIPFVLFELPANFILKKTKPYIWLSFLTFGCGITNLSMGFVDSYGALLGVRFLLGVFESGIGAGSVMVIASYYKRYELPTKLSLWYLSGIAGGAFGGLLAYGIVRMSGDAGLSGWRWIFIVEGSITAFAGILMYFWMVDWPEACQFLTLDERGVLLSRLRADRLDELRMDRWDTKRLFSDWRIWIGTLMYFSVINSTYSTAFFSPSILQSDMGYTAVKAQLMSFPPYALAAVGCLSFNMLSDRLRHRYGFIIGGVLIGTIGYAILLAQKEYPNMPVGAKYFALILLVSAPQIVQPLTVAWMMNNVSGHHKRAFASACQIGFGSAGGIVASNIYFSTDAPYFRVGYAVSLVLLLLNGLLATFLYFALRRENKARADGKRDYLVDGQTTDNLGDDHPDFRFVY